VEVDGRRRRRFSLRRGGPAAPRTDVLSRADRTGSAVDALKGSGPRPTPTCHPTSSPVSEILIERAGAGWDAALAPERHKSLPLRRS